MKFTTIYKNGNPQNFFIKLDSPKEFNFLQPYFIYTSMDNSRKGNILEMFVLFSGEVFAGRQRHGYGYSCSADVFGTLIHDIILKEYKNELSEEAKMELKAINTHDEQITITEKTLAELAAINEKKFAKKMELKKWRL